MGDERKQMEELHRKLFDALKGTKSDVGMPVLADVVAWGLVRSSKDPEQLGNLLATFVDMTRRLACRAWKEERGESIDLVPNVHVETSVKN